jgi:hypothetical protein
VSFPPVRRGGATLSASLALALLLLAGLFAPAGAQPPPPVRSTVGIFVTNLHALNPARGTFGATFWVWSVDPGAFSALRTMEFVNADQAAVNLENTEPRGAVSWSQRKITGTFRHDWDLRNFPFDRHTLEILLEEGVQEESGLVYVADAANSGHAVRGVVEGWRVAGLQVGVATASYPTNFGNPSDAGPESRFTRFRAVAVLERVDYSGFLKLTATLYAGFLVCAIGCVMHVTPSTFGARISLLVASLFSLVVSMRTASVTLGSEHGATLIDKLHMAGLVYVVLVSAVTVLVRVRLSETSPEVEPTLVRLDRWVCFAAAGLFLLANAVLLAAASAG